MSPPVAFDLSSNPAGEKRMVEILLALMDAGYSGVRYEMLSDFHDGLFFWAPLFNTHTPEGRLFGSVCQCALNGEMPPPVSECLDIVELSYLELGLPLPTQQKAR